MQVCSDTKKQLTYSKNEGTWYWHNRDDEAAQQGPFKTFAEAVRDAVAPYFDEDSDD